MFHLRTIPLILLLGLSALNYGQFATVYVTPPTDGCNGVWAVQVTSLYCTPVSPYTFAMEPSGCMQLDGWGEEMGVFLMPLCALPCSLTVTTGDGVTCSGSTSDAPIGISENQVSQVRVSVQGGNIELVSDVPLPQQQARVIDASGRVLLMEMLPPGQRWDVPAPSTPGAYIISIQSASSSIFQRSVIVP